MSKSCFPEEFKIEAVKLFTQESGQARWWRYRTAERLLQPLANSPSRPIPSKPAGYHPLRKCETALGIIRATNSQREKIY